MRKAQKQQAEELIKQIEEAHDQIKQYMEQGSVQPAMELLEDCQNGGIAIGTLIEETEGEGHPTVSLLEDYCEVTYQIHQNLADNKEINANKAHKLLRQKLIKVGNSLRNEIPVRTEAVFLPYKASMWDSLESVWKAADEDPNCDAYVIPIPYYDKNPDGSFREMHYEGGQYPDYVPITKYDEFDFEAHRPDMIYIHNPYDDLNFVTSVEPFFYSNKLKKFTDKLIYIPYFVLGEIKPDDDTAIEGMKHFCTVPGVINADKVIVQSENMKQVYIKVLLDATNNHSEAARTYWENKIIGVGSPKIDKVLNMNKEGLKIPQKWMEVIKKPDGSWKKVIFYNTSVGALLLYNEKMLQKMEYVFRVFMENQEEVALLWRPHPLVKATVESMRPQLWIEYDRIVQKYREEGWGIYDETADLDRAIQISNAYYGDASSVVQLYQNTGKPVMLQDSSIKSNNATVLLSTYNFIDTGDNIYFASKNITNFFRYEKSTGKLFSLMRKVQGNMFDKRFQFGGVCRFQDKIIFAPFFGTEVIIYDMYNPNTVERIRMPIKKGESSCFCKRVIAYKSYIYFICDVYSETLCLDMDKMQISSLGTWKDVMAQCKEKPEFVGINTCGDICILEDILWVPLNLNNHILEFNLQTMAVNVHQINVPEMLFSSICFDGESFWLTGNRQEIVKWNKDTGKIDIIDSFPIEFQKFQKEGYWDQLFTRSFLERGYIYLFPMTANMAIKINIQTNEVESFYVWEELSSCYTVEKWDQDTFYIEWGNEDYIEINHSMIIDLNGNIKGTDIFMADRNIIEWPMYEIGEEIYSENSALTVERFIQDKIKCKSQRCEILRSKCGEQIFKSMR